MAKAASQSKMNGLHDKVADVFIKVLERYEVRMDIADMYADGKIEIDPEEISAEVLDKLMGDGYMPSPAMMSAITKFLKDNEVLFEKEKIDDMSEHQRALDERRKNRPNLAQLSLVPKIA